MHVYRFRELMVQENSEKFYSSNISVFPQRFDPAEAETLWNWERIKEPARNWASWICMSQSL